MPKVPNVSDSSLDPLQAEAMAVARSIQKPGQTKEQTRLIAQGIAKGLEQYKRQQSAKARERDKARKRHEKARQAADQLRDRDRLTDDLPKPVEPNRALQVSGVSMLLMAAFHGLPLFAGWSLRVDDWVVPLWFSLAIILTMIVLAVWSLRSASTNPH